MKERHQPELLLVHCVDTEGPLDESIESTFSRLEEIYGIKAEPTASNLLKIQQKRAPFIPANLTDLAARTFSKKTFRTFEPGAKLMKCFNPIFQTSSEVGLLTTSEANSPLAGS